MEGSMVFIPKQVTVLYPSLRREGRLAGFLVTCEAARISFMPKLVSNVAKLFNLDHVL